MSMRLSRRKMAAYVADKLAAGQKPALALKEVAAYLTETKRTREQELLVRDIEEALAARGIVIADVVSAHPLSRSVKVDIAKLVGGETLQLREAINPEVLGGVRVDIPGKQFDGTIRRKLTQLKAKQL
jgi:F-type H+-transporting ATPase subunit delta